jgi:hypothetical protein
VSSLCSVEVSFQIPSEKFHLCQEVHEDVNSINIASNHEVELVKLEYQEIGQVYLDPIYIYMEKFFITEQQSISSISVVLQVYQAPYDEDQAHNHFQVPLTDSVRSSVKKRKTNKVSNPI